MKILPKRTMFLDNQRVVAGKEVEVSDSEGKLAIRHGWATEAKGGKKGRGANQNSGGEDEGGDEGQEESQA